MQVNQALTSVEKSDDLDEVDFGIESSPLAFEILSAGIYTDRVLAIIRELSCNAYDSHVESKNLDQFEIHLPNNLEPTFSIRDRGTGLPPEMVKRVYTRYFKSTKTHSNDLVGFMGLGSKSPFSYVESFTVTSYWNGIKYMFTAFKDANKKPKIASMGECASDEPNGIEVSFPVSRSDFWEFKEKAQQALRFFNQKPNVTGHYDFKIPEFDYLLTGSGWSVCKKRDDESYVVMGNVGYSFDSYVFDGTESEFDSRERKLVEWGVHLFVPLGAVTPAASREKITWTVESRKLVKELIVQALAAIQAQATAGLKNATNVWEVRKLLAEAKKGILSEITDVDDAYDWNGTTVRESVYMSDFVAANIACPTSIECLSMETHSHRRRWYHNRYGTSHHSTPKQSGGGLQRWKIENFSVDIEVFFINDLNRGGYAAAQRYMSENTIDKAVMFSSDVTKEFLEAAGCAVLVIKVSSLPKPVRAPRGSGGAGRSNRTLIQTWDKNGFWKDAEVDMEEGGIYLEVKRDKVKRPTIPGAATFHFENPNILIDDLVEEAKKLGFDEELYVIRPCDLSKLEKHDGWITLYQWIEDTLRQRADLVDLACKSYSWSTVANKAVSELVEYADRLGDNSPMKKAIEIYNDINAAHENKEVSAFLALNSYHKIHDIKVDNDASSKIKQALACYPLIDFVDSLYRKPCQEAVIDYVNIVDKNSQATVAPVALAS